MSSLLVKESIEKFESKAEDDLMVFVTYPVDGELMVYYKVLERDLVKASPKREKPSGLGSDHNSKKKR